MSISDVDQTILPILKEIGCSFSVSSLAEFTTDHLVEACSVALHTINEQYKFPIRLPQGNAGRFRVCTGISDAIKELGYTGLSGYQNFLYPNEKDVRKLLIWLLDKLPKHDVQDESQEVVGASTLLYNDIVKSIRDWYSKSWDPVVNCGVTKAPTHVFDSCRLEQPQRSATVPAAKKEYWASMQPLVSVQCAHRHQFVPSLLERNCREVVLAQEREQEWAQGGDDVKERKAQKKNQIDSLIGEAFRAAHSQEGDSHTAGEFVNELLNGYGGQDEDGKAGSTLISRRTAFQQEVEKSAQVMSEDGKIASVTANVQAPEEQEAEMKRKHEEEVAELTRRLTELRNSMDLMDTADQQDIVATRQMESELNALEESTQQLERNFRVKERTLALLPEAEKNLAELRKISAASSQRLINLAQEWESHRAPMLAKYRRKKQQLNDRKDEVRNKLEQIKRMREEMKQAATEIREKEGVYTQVLEELNKLPKSINRQVYVRRIMDIVRNLDKQKEDIAKILADVRQVQKDINSVAETSKRSAAVVDDTIFQAANKIKDKEKDPAATTAYRYLVELRKGFDRLVTTVTDMGRLSNELRELNSRIEALESRNTNLNMERIKTDLAQVKKENKDLAGKVGGAAGAAAAAEE